MTTLIDIRRQKVNRSETFCLSVIVFLFYDYFTSNKGIKTHTEAVERSLMDQLS